MDPVLNWTLKDILLRPDLYLNAIYVGVGLWRKINPNTFDFLLIAIPTAVTWFVYKTPWTWDESVIKAIFKKLNLPWKGDAKEDAKNVSS
jgi:hypothetical protein